MKNLLRSSLVTLGLFASSSAFALTFGSTFDTDDAGWMVGNIDNLNTPMNSPDYHSSGGNPGGYISTTDTKDIVGFFAPSTIAGDRSEFYGGNASFDLRDEVTADGPAYPALFLYGDGHVISIAGPAPSDTVFTHYSFTLTEAGFFNYQGGGESPGTDPVTAAEFKDVLANLTNVAILADWHNGADLTDLDNVSVSTPVVIGPTPVPLPASAPMFGAALVALGVVGFGLRRKASAA